MPNINELEVMPRRVLNIFYVLDTSGSMDGAPIGTLNDAMGETIEILSQQAKKNADALLKIAVLQFNSGCEWLQPSGPEDAVDFVWQDLKAGGITDMGAALKELGSKLSKDAYLSSMTGSFLPVIIFMTDGGATDDYEKALTEIRKNKWFSRATKIGFALGESPDKKMIAEVVGNAEAVLATADLELFSRLIKFVSTTSSMLCSASHTSHEDVSGADIVQMAVAEEKSHDLTVGTGDDTLLNLPVEEETDDGWGDDDWD